MDVTAGAQFRPPALQTAAPVRARGRPAPWGRLAAVLVTAVVVQGAVAPRLAPPGAAPDLLLVAAVAVAASAGPRRAAGFGFAAGLAGDLFLATPYGLSAAAFTVVARAAAALPAPRRPVLVAPRVAVGAVVAGALVLSGAAALGAAPAPSPAALRPLVHAALLAGAVSPAAFVAVRRLTSLVPVGGPGSV